MMSPARFELPFNVNSPWRLGVGDGAVFAPDDDPCHLALGDVDGPGQAWVNRDHFSHPITKATTRDPLVTVTDVDHGRTHRDRIPAHARIASGSDGHMHVITPDGRTVLEHWATRRLPDGSYICRRRVAVSLAGTGLGPDNGVRAYGGSAIAGLICTWEIKTGRIDHPLAIALRPDQLRRGWVWPATTEDGPDHAYTGPVPMGSYLAIPRSVDVGAMQLSPAALMVARACQEFGVYVVDASGSTCFYVEDDTDPATAAWHAEVVGPKWSGRDLRPIFKALRVVVNNTEETPNGGSIADRRLH